jgi:hypothetical protein
VAYSGTDKNSVSLTSWMTVDSVDKFSLSALYSEADKILQKGVNSIINDNSIGTGGSI